MARKESITKEMLLDVAFELVNEEGIENLTARKLAAKAGCSTQPIFRTYKNMDEVAEDVFEKAKKYYSDYCKNSKKSSSVPFVDLGLTYISFAQKHKNIFRLLFLTEQKFGHGLYEIINGELQYVGHEFIRARNTGCTAPDKLFQGMWTFIHGVATMSLTGEYDLSVEETKEMLTKAYKAFK